MRSIKDETNLNQKKVLLRLDLNVPLDNGKITDTTRIDKILPTINFLLKSEAIEDVVEVFNITFVDTRLVDVPYLTIPTEIIHR